MFLETQRLRIVPFEPSMAQAVHENSLDDDTRRFVPDEVFETVEDAADTIAFLMSCYSTGEGPLVYPVLLADACIGYVQAVPLEEGGWEIGYHIGSRYTGHGYATEAVSAFLPAISRRLGITELHGICLAENIASRKVLEHCGFLPEWEGTGDYQGALRNIVRYRWQLF